jgi:hypothetical protein
MSLELGSFDEDMKAAIRHFWFARSTASQGQTERGVTDQGRRGEVTTGKNLDGIVSLVRDLVVANGMPATSGALSR